MKYGWFVIALLLGQGTANASPVAPLDLNRNLVFGTAAPWGAIPSRVVWAPGGGSYLYELPDQDLFHALPVRQHWVIGGRDRVVLDPRSFRGRPETPAALSWSPDGRLLAFTVHGSLYVRDMRSGSRRKIAKKASDPAWSPRGNALAYVHGDDLYVTRSGAGAPARRLTYGGKTNTLLNGDLDWVYPEELGTSAGFAWSPDGRTIAYLRMDESRVTNFPIVDFLGADNGVAPERYPLAGERNPRVSLRAVDVGGARDRLIYDAARGDEYLPFFGWAPSSQELLVETLDRHQRHLRVLAWNRSLQRPRIIYRQNASTWVDDVPLPKWLADGSSVWLLDRDGTPGVYLRTARGALHRLTGKYRSFALLGVDPKTRTAYATAAFPTRRDRALLAIPLRGGVVRNLTPLAGSHAISLAPNFAYFVDTQSTLNAPPMTHLVATATGRPRATLASRNDALASAMLPSEMLSVPSRYGALDAWMIKPPGFDARKRYPVVVYVYGGPDAPTTANGFGGQNALYHQLLAREGFIVFSIDGPASQVDSSAHVRLLYHNFGPGSLLGQEIGAAYLRSLPYVDAKRIGIWGWSFGGYETTYALTHSSSFKAGAAVAPVTDWHYYDTIYTERYMGLPREDPKAYHASSVLPAARRLHGDLLISHGTSDDNVHMANTISLLQQFVIADKTNVDFMVYPRRVHSIAGVPQRRHLYEHMLDWWLHHL